jgi:hypothetical protein
MSTLVFDSTPSAYGDNLSVDEAEHYGSIIAFHVGKMFPSLHVSPYAGYGPSQSSYRNDGTDRPLMEAAQRYLELYRYEWVPSPEVRKKDRRFQSITRHIFGVVPSVFVVLGILSASSNQPLFLDWLLTAFSFAVGGYVVAFALAYLWWVVSRPPDMTQYRDPIIDSWRSGINKVTP